MVQSNLDELKESLSTLSTWKMERRSITIYYGYVTFVICLLFIILLPRWNKISNYLYYKFLKVNRFFKLNLESSFLRVNPMSAQMIIFWSIVLSILSLVQTRWDIRFIAARLGRVPVYCLPTVLFLTLRPSPLPGVLYLALLPIHKWLSRIVILQSLLHTLVYLFIMTKSNTLWKLLRADNFFGIVAMLAFLTIMFTSLPFIRRKFFNFFFINHYLCTWIVTLTLYFHVRPGIPYLTLLNCFILIYQIYYKFKISSITELTVSKISDHMVVVDIPNDKIKVKCNIPGSHIRLIDYDDSKWKITNYLKLITIPIQHPYTLASLPSDKSQKLIVREGKYRLKDKHQYLVTGSYQPHLAFVEPYPKLKNTPMSSNLNTLLFQTKVKKCLIVVGGSAVSFALPILRVLNYNGSMVKIIWVIRDHEDLKVLDYFKTYLVNDDCIDIFITGNYTLSEKINFKDALNELHRKKRELELKQETEILSGGYSFYSNNNNSAPEIHSTFENKALSPWCSPCSDHQIEHLTDNEALPLLSKPASSYGLSTFQSSSLPKNRKSCIELRSHNINSSTSYNTETIDIELNEAEIYRENAPIIPANFLSSPSAGVDQIDNENDLLDARHKNISEPHVSSGTATKTKKLSAILAKLNSKSGENKLNSSKKWTSSINQKLLCRSGSTATSSALYDDLEDYWVLKNSYSRIEFGRPKLGLYYYSWCIGSSCNGPLVSLQSGESVCYNIKDDPQSAYNDQLNELYSNATFLANKKARLNEKGGKPDEEILIIGAGPNGLVDNVRLWANDCGFSYHEESFSV